MTELYMSYYNTILNKFFIKWSNFTGMDITLNVEKDDNIYFRFIHLKF